MPGLDYQRNMFLRLPKVFARLVLIPSFIVMLIAGANAQSENPWQISSPEQQGINSAILAAAVKNAKQNGNNIHSLLIIKNDHLVLDAAFYPYKNSYVHDLASCTKSITSLLIGIAIDQGFIKSENEHILDFFPEYNLTNDTLKTVTIKDLLNMSSGFQCSWNDGEKELGEMRAGKDWVKYMLSLPFASYPNAQFSYCSGNYYLLAEILQRTTKVSCLEFAQRYLFKPMHFAKSYWLSNYKGVNHGWGDLHISIYDFAKIGCLVLNDGTWDGKQIISKQWIKKIQPLHKVKKTESYGYGWWLDSENPDEIQAEGRGGQRLFIFKDRNMVIATYGGGGGYDAGDIDNIVLEAIQSYRNGKNGDPSLQKEITDIALPDTPTLTAVNFPDDELKKNFLLADNIMGLKSLRFEKRQTGYYILLDYVDGSKDEHPIGMDGQYRISNEHTFGLPMAVKGRWANDTLKIDYNRLCRIEDFRLSIVFKKGNSIELKMVEASFGIDQAITGKSL